MGHWKMTSFFKEVNYEVAKGNLSYPPPLAPFTKIVWFSFLGIWEN